MNDQPQRQAGFIDRILINTFGLPKGVFGWLGGFLMARSNREMAQWVIELLAIRPSDQVLEIGFGPGIGVDLVNKQLIDGTVAGIDYSHEMVAMASRRNQAAIASGKISLRHASALSLPFPDGQFDQVFSINSLQVWPDQMTGLQEIFRVLKPTGKMALGFTPHAQPRPDADTLKGMLEHAGFKEIRLATNQENICLLATMAQS